MSNLVFSKASRFSNPISHAMPRGRPGEGSKDSLTMGIRANGNGLTWNLVSSLRYSLSKVANNWAPNQYSPRSSKSLSERFTNVQAVAFNLEEFQERNSFA